MAKSAKDIIAEARNKRGGMPEGVTATPIQTETPSLDSVPDAIKPFVTAILPFVQPNVKPEQLRALVDDAVLRLLPKPITIIVKKDGEEGEGKKFDLVHKQFPEVLELVKAFPETNLGPFLTGPAGSAKTTCGAQVAEALNIAFYCLAIGPQTSKGDLIGYMDAHGRYVETALYKAFKFGGLVLFDEMDAGNPGVLTIKNSLTAQPSYLFPNGEIVQRHADFRFMGAGNTYGSGGNLQYIGRNALDAATMNRYVPVLWDYDPELEKALAIRAATSVPDAIESAAGLAVKWTARVQALRKAAEKAGIRTVISPRQSMGGAALLARGTFTWERVEQMLIWRDGGITKDDRERILSHV